MTTRPPQPRHLPSHHHEALHTSRTAHGFVLTTASKSFEEENTSLTDTPENMNDEQPVVRRPRSGSEGLDFLAALAERERDALIAEAAAATEMPPPRPQRPRCVSNPEDMMCYEATLSSNARSPLVLPPSILEEELAEATVAVQEACAQDPETLLTNTRARLLEEVSEQCAEKGEIILPHTLSKYKEVRTNLSLRLGRYLNDVVLSQFSFPNILDIQLPRSYWYLHENRTCCHSSPIPQQADETKLAEKDSLQLSQKLG